MLKVLVHIFIPRVSAWSGWCFLYIIHLNFLLPINELFFFLLCMELFSYKSAETMTLDSVNWIDVKIILLQACHWVCMSFTQLLLYKQLSDRWVRYIDYAMVLQQVYSRVFHHLVYYVWLFANGGVVDFRSLHACAHEGDGMLFFHLILLSECYNKWVVGGEGV